MNTSSFDCIMTNTLKTTLATSAICTTLIAASQSITPQVVATSGTHYSSSGHSLSWTIGESATATLSDPSNTLTQGFHQPEQVLVSINIKAFLQGPYRSISGLMHDSLRAQGLIPLSEPYSALGYSNINGGAENLDPSVLNTTGPNAIIDWVHVELRDKTDDQNVIATRNALLQADGDIVEVDGISPVEFDAASDDYYLSIQHRNHVHIMSFSTVALSDSPVAVDFSDGSTPTFGTEAQVDISGTKALWSGDVTDDGIVKYTGSLNDRDPILVAIGGMIPTNTIAGYLPDDVNMDGTVKYTGASNDRDLILQNIGGVVPTNTRSEQMP